MMLFLNIIQSQYIYICYSPPTATNPPAVAATQATQTTSDQGSQTSDAQHDQGSAVSAPAVGIDVSTDPPASGNESGPAVLPSAVDQASQTSPERKGSSSGLGPAVAVQACPSSSKTGSATTSSATLDEGYKSGSTTSTESSGKSTSDVSQMTPKTKSGKAIFLHVCIFFKICGKLRDIC